MAQRLPIEAERAIQTLWPGYTGMRKLKDGYWEISFGKHKAKTQFPTLNYIKTFTKFGD